MSLVKQKPRADSSELGDFCLPLLIGKAVKHFPSKKRAFVQFVEKQINAYKPIIITT